MTDESRIPTPQSRATRTIGIDPGSQRTGVGVIDVDETGRLTPVFHAALVVGGEASFPLRLKRIFDELCDIIAAHRPIGPSAHRPIGPSAHRPTECGIERVFMARNPDSALKLGQARGAAICALVNHGIAVHEYAATEVKQSVVGSGRGDKTQVQYMVGVLLGLKGPLQADAADALAVAVAHAHARASLERVGIPRSAWRRRR